MLVTHAVSPLRLDYSICPSATYWKLWVGALSVLVALKHPHIQPSLQPLPFRVPTWKTICSFFPPFFSKKLKRRIIKVRLVKSSLPWMFLCPDTTWSAKSFHLKSFLRDVLPLWNHPSPLVLFMCCFSFAYLFIHFLESVSNQILNYCYSVNELCIALLVVTTV